MEFTFDSEVIYWRGPAPFFYAPVPQDQADEIRKASKPFTTSLFPKDGAYLVPLKDAVRKPTGITAGDTIHIEMTLKPRR